MIWVMNRNLRKIDIFFLVLGLRMNVWIYGKTNRTTSLLDQKTHIFDGDNFYEKIFFFYLSLPLKGDEH